MRYNTFQNEQLSALGFGLMRLPLSEDKSIDKEKTAQMADYAISHGVNYFDTAWPYHGGNSETVIGEILSRYPRESFYLASKFPGHQIASAYEPAKLFEKQLRKCRVDYFDFYLLHNVCENSMQTYLDPQWKIIDTFLKLREEGKIRHLGFSSHGGVENLREFLDLYGSEMEFCQIQLNWLDWTLQDAKAKYELLTERGIPVWVMEPLRGGRLAHLNADDEKLLKALRPEENIPAWSFRFLQTLPNVKMILSGMSAPEQMNENVNTFEIGEPLNSEETAALLAVAEGMKQSVPCTGCRYCTESCPMELEIPTLIAACNDLRFAQAGFTVGMMTDALPEDKRSSACLGCGACAQVCPQKIDIPEVMRELTELLKKMPKWAEVCREREEAARRLEQAENN